MYKILGADQKEYGPVTEEQLRQWIAEGRANALTSAKFGDGPWKPLSSFPEFAAALGTLPPPPAAAPTSPPPLGAPTTTPLSPLPGSAPQTTSGMAVAGLICSILGLFCCGPIFSTLGLVFSALGLSQINREPSKYSGKGAAIAGLVLALVGYVIFAIMLSTGVLSRTFRHFPRHF
jgi:hypothetical protein